MYLIVDRGYSLGLPRTGNKKQLNLEAVYNNDEAI
jgi:hypothetical protein